MKETVNKFSGLWDDMVQAFHCANNLLWKPEYENHKHNKYLKVNENTLKFSGLSREEIRDGLKSLNLLFLVEEPYRDYKNNTKVYHIIVPVLIDLMNGMSNEDLLTMTGIEGAVLRILNQAYINQYVIEDKHGGYGALESITKRWNLDPNEFLLNVCDFWKHPDDYPVMELPKLMGFKKKPFTLKVGVSN